VEQGLTSNTINCIYKDYKGFVWLGTANGLNRFDGTTVLSFDGLRDKSIVSIDEPDTTNLYILAEREFYKYDRQQRKTTQIHFINNEIPLLKKIILDKDKNAYLIGNQTLYFFEKNGTAPFLLENSFFDDKTVTDISIDDENNCWITTLEGLIKYYPETKKNEIYKNSPDDKFLCMAFHKEKLYIGTQNNRILCFDTRSHTFTEISAIETTYIQTIIYYQDKLYVGTNGNGLKIVDLNDRKITNIIRNPSQANTLSTNAIYSLFIDENSFWIGTFSGGLNYIPSVKKQFETFRNPDINTSTQNIRSFCIDNHGLGIYGTRNGVIYNQNGDYKWLTTDNTPELKSNIILSIFPFENNYLIGTYAGGLYIFETDTKSIKKFDNNPIFSEASFYSIIKENDEALWFGTLDGLIRYELNTKKYTVYNTQNSDIISNDVYSILKDSSGRIWVATRVGICYYTNGIFRQTADIDLSFVGIVRHLFQDSEGNIWLGCENQGAVKISSSLNNYAHYTIQNILPDNYVGSIIEGSRGQIWMTTPKGIVLYDNNTSGYRIFSLYNGIPSYGFNDAAVQKTDNGIIWWGNEKGLLLLDSLDLQKQYIQDIFITKVVIDGFPEDYEIRKLFQAPEYLKTINLPSSQKNFIFRFSDLEYDYPSSIVYEYKLEGIRDTSWHKALAGNDILIADIPSGYHSLKIRQAGIHSSEKTFMIDKAESYLLYWLLLIIIFILFACFYIYKLFIKKLRKYKNETRNTLETAKPKYKNQKIEKDELENIKYLLIRYMEEEKPYLNPDLKLDDIAQAINCPKTKISQVLNQYLNTNFSNFISKYRIEMFKKKAAEGLIQQYTLSALAKECGFSSRSSFFHTMKKLTGQTPSEFLKDAGIYIKD